MSPCIIDRRLLLAIGLAIAGGGCERQERTPLPAAMNAPQAPDLLDEDDAQIAERYQALATRYDELGVTMEDHARWMAQMHAQMVQLQRSGYGHGHACGHRHGDGMLGGDHRLDHGIRGGGMRGGPPARGPMPGRMGRCPREMASAMDRWHHQMAARNERWAAQARSAGRDDVAQMHHDTAALHRKAARDLDAERRRTGPAAAAPDAPAAPDGAALFARGCAGCHGRTGEGVPGAFPALAGNPVLDGPDHRLIEIVRDGLTGPIEVNGERFDGVMPAFAGALSSAELAAILTYVRRAWGTSGGAITAAQVEGASS